MIADEIVDEPPYEIKGSVTPFVGIIPILLEICIMDWKANKKANPEIDNIENKLLL